MLGSIACSPPELPQIVGRDDVNKGIVNERMRSVTKSLNYVEEKGVRQVLSAVVERLLTEQPLDPIEFMVNALNKHRPGTGGHIISDTKVTDGTQYIATRGSGLLDAAGVASAFLEADDVAPQATVQRLLTIASQACKGTLSFYSAPGGRGRKAVIKGESEECRRGFKLVASSDTAAKLDTLACAEHTLVMNTALERCIACVGSVSAAVVRSSLGVEGVLVAELPEDMRRGELKEAFDRVASVNSVANYGGLALMPAVRLWALALGERLQLQHWRSEAETGRKAMDAMLTVLDDYQQLRNSYHRRSYGKLASCTVPTSVLQGGLSKENFTQTLVWCCQPDLASMDLSDLGVGEALPVEEKKVFLENARECARSRHEVVCVHDLCAGSFEKPLAARAVCVPIVQHNTAEENIFSVVQFVDTSIQQHSQRQGFEHFDVAAAEMLPYSVLPAMLASRAQLLADLDEVRTENLLEAIVDKMKNATRVMDLIEEVEPLVGQLLGAECCRLYFTDDGRDEVWRPPVDDLDGITFPMGTGFLGGVIKNAQNLLLSNERKIAAKEEHSSHLLETRGKAAGVSLARSRSKSKETQGKMSWAVSAEKAGSLSPSPMRKLNTKSVVVDEELASIVVVNDPRGHPDLELEANDNNTMRNVIAAPLFGIQNSPGYSIVGALEVRNKVENSCSSTEFFTQADRVTLKKVADVVAQNLGGVMLDLLWTKGCMDRQEEEPSGRKDMPSKKSLLKKSMFENEALKSEYYTAKISIRASTRGDHQHLPLSGRNPASAASGVQQQAQLISIGEEGKPQISESRTTFLSVDKCGDYSLPSEADIAGWEVDYWELSEEDEYSLFLQGLTKSDITSQLTLPIQALHAFFFEIKDNYKSVPYHNIKHAMATLHYAFKLMVAANLQSNLSAIDQFALIVGGLCHDVGHRGRNSAFETGTRSDLALRYNDNSPLENHHCALAFEIMLGGPKSTRNILACVSAEEYGEARRKTIAGILATDMKHHGDHVKIMQQLDVEPGIEDVQSQVLIELLLHTADVSNPIMPTAVSKRWGDAIAEEFSLQVDEEKRLGIPVTVFMDGLRDKVAAAKSNVGFIDFVFQPLWRPFYELNVQGLQQPQANVEENREAYLHIMDTAGQVNEKLHRKSRNLKKKLQKGMAAISLGRGGLARKKSQEGE